jgi:dihydroorotate dehydrogenase (NAD+) catalytic subunit
MDVRPRPGTEGAPSAAPDLRVRLAGLEMRNPVVTASGTFASGREYADFIDLSRLGAVVTKGVSLEQWAGNDSPRIAETASGMLNSIGLQNPGVEAFAGSDLGWLAEQDVPVIVNVSGHSVAEYAAVAERLDAEAAVDALEVNISCPNVDAGGMAFGTDCASAAEVTAAVRAVTRKPVIVKLSPNVTDIAEIARAVEAAGADAVSLINTLLGMAIDARTRRPKLARVVGGLSGPAIKPVALRMVWQVYRAVRVPIVGMGGVMTGEDAVEFMLAGATAVAVGTASFVDPRTAVRVVDGIAEYCREAGVTRVADLVGALRA